ncbi:hypothetical protein D5S18_08560 [Nocardia panacis]|uniref:Uncharacterized protein n=1 Tax=Nocardia panacis TaxID=2340916 RepID=A0A3A4KLE6_9NOCA|nr:hypothetical protein [Nocardia panacis]RJO76378.1 hypothetical protein D5S18_08560 [Nocardia panacis]
MTMVLLAVPFALWMAVRVGRADPCGAVTTHLLDLFESERALRGDPWQLEPSHRAPSRPLTPEQAHWEMQRHRTCGTDLCPMKHAAFWTLVDAGQTIPDPRASRIV